MKKIILGFLIGLMLLAPFSVKVKAEITNDDVVAQVKAQIEALQVQLQIQMLLEKIAELKAQIAVILSAQASQTATINQQSQVINSQSQVINSQTETLNQIVSNTCTPDWFCTDWSVCDNFSQTRTCGDRNGCGKLNEEPSESQNCVMPLNISCSGKFSGDNNIIWQASVSGGNGEYKYGWNCPTKDDNGETFIIKGGGINTKYCFTEPDNFTSYLRQEFNVSGKDGMTVYDTDNDGIISNIVKLFVKSGNEIKRVSCSISLKD